MYELIIEIHIKRELSELNIFMKLIHNIKSLRINFILIVES